MGDYISKLELSWNIFSLFRNKRFMLDEMLQQNSSKIAILLEYKNRFSIRATLYFFLMNADIHYGKNKVHSRKWKKKLRGCSYLKIMANFEMFRCNITSKINLSFFWWVFCIWMRVVLSLITKIIQQYFSKYNSQVIFCSRYISTKFVIYLVSLAFRHFRLN